MKIILLLVLLFGATYFIHLHPQYHAVMVFICGAIGYMIGKYSRGI